VKKGGALPVYSDTNRSLLSNPRFLRSEIDQRDNSANKHHGGERAAGRLVGFFGSSPPKSLARSLQVVLCT
jgi:hypothetical protein